MRRTNGRSPPFVTILLIVFILILSYNCWTLSVQHSDLRNEVEKLQTEVKISALNEEQSEKKNVALQDRLHSMEDMLSNLKQKILSGEDSLKFSKNEFKKKEYEVTSLRSELSKLMGEINSLRQDIEDAEATNERLKKEYEIAINQKDDAFDAVSEKDTIISNLKKELELIKSEVERVRNEKGLSVMDSQPVGPLNIPNAMRKADFYGPGHLKPLELKHSDVRAKDLGIIGMHFHNQPIFPREPPDVVRPPPKFSVANLEKNVLVPPLLKHKDKNENLMKQLPYPQAEQVPPPGNHEIESNDIVPPHNQVLQRPSRAVDGKRKENVPSDHRQPLQVQNAEENLDAAIDENERMAEEDPLDDQDEEGKEIKYDIAHVNEEGYDVYDKEDEDNKKNDKEPLGIGAPNVPIRNMAGQVMKKYFNRHKVQPFNVVSHNEANEV